MTELYVTLFIAFIVVVVGCVTALIIDVFDDWVDADDD